MKRKPTYEELEQRVNELEEETLELQQAKEALRESEERFRAIFEGSLDAVFLADPESGIILDANPAASELFSRPYEQIVGLHYTQLHPSRFTEYAKETFAEAIRDRQLHPVEIQILRSDGSERPVEISAQLIQIGGDPVCYGIFRDITQRKQAQAALQDRLETWQVFFNAIQDVAVMLDRNGYVIEANSALARQLGRSVDEIVGRRLRDFISGEVGKLRQSYGDRVIHSGEAVRFEDERNGKWFDNIMSPVFDAQRKVAKVVIIARDITVNKRTVEALEASEKRYRAVVENQTELITRFLPDGRLTFVNDAVCRYFGKHSADLVGSGYMPLIPEEDHKKLEDHLASISRETPAVTIEHRVIALDGQVRWMQWTNQGIFDEHGHIVEYQCVGRDVTELRQMERELAKVEKLESLGILAGGIAHDFNNILTAILANLSMARIWGDLQDDVSKMLADAEIATVRAKGLTERLLTFSRGGMPVKKTTSIAKLLRDTTEFSLSGSNVRPEYAIAQDLWSVEIDEGQIGQVIQNLAINAKQAMPEGGVIQVSAQNVVFGEEDPLPLKGGKYVKISVKDEGMGIPEKHLPKIFNPFFTTKHEGSGLGLAICFSVVKNHGGHIDLVSSIGVGTTVDVYLPAFEETIKPLEKEKKKPSGGEERILLIDDEELVRRSAGNVLTRLGYDVAFAKDGGEGIRLYKKEMDAGRPFDVVIVDLTIPGGTGGKGAIQGLLKIDPQAKVIASSGYSNDPVMSEFRKYGFAGVLGKPYNIEELGRILHEVISEVAR